MSILEFMSFDPSWFLSLPGLLISGGVLLLLIALIVFIATSKKDKGATVDPTVDGSIPLVEGPDALGGVVPNGMDNNAVPADMNNVFNNGDVDNSMINDMTMNNQVPVSNPGFVPTGVVDNGIGNVNPVPVPSVPEVSLEPQAMPNVNAVDMPSPIDGNGISPEPVMPTSSNISFDNVPQATINDTINPEMKPVIDLVSVSPNPVVDFSQGVQGPQVNNPVSPVSDTNVRPIYGGANPLENTASIPTILNHSAYNGEPIIPNSVMEEVKVVDNNVPSSPVEPVVPAVEPIAAPTPIESTPMPSAPVVPSAPTPIVEPSVEPSVVDNGVETLDF